MKKDIYLRQTRHGFQLAALILSLLLAISFIASAGEIVGIVKDEVSGEPVENAVVFILHVPTQLFSPPDPNKPERMDQIYEEFEPRILPIVVGTKVVFPNKDQVLHNVYSDSRAMSFELPLYKGEVKPAETFDKIGIVRLGCTVHDWMSAIVLVLQNPYFGMTNKEGKYKIRMRNTPVGEYKVLVWHEFSHKKLSKTVQDVSIKASSPTTIDHLLAVGPSKHRKRRSGY